MSGRPKHYGQHERRSKRSAAVFSLIQTRSTFVTVLSIGASAVYLLRIRQQIQTVSRFAAMSREFTMSKTNTVEYMLLLPAMFAQFSVCM